MGRAGSLSRAIADTEGDAPVSDTGPKAVTHSNRFNSAPPTGRTGLASLGVLVPLLPVGAYFWLIHQYSVNVVYADQFSDVALLDHWYRGTLSLSDLWASHGDHRILFPNLIVIALAQFTHLNVVFEEYLSGAMLVAATALLISTHRRRAPSTPLISYTPLTLVLFSFVQYQNTLWGFQMAWYLITLALALALFLLDRPALTGWVFVGAVAATVVGSFSSLQGLLIWPVGLLVLCVHRRPRRFLLIWIACALITAALYFHQLNPSEYSNQTYVFTHPVEAFKFFLFLIGSVLGVELTHSPWPVILFGAIVMMIAIVLMARYRWRGEQGSGLVGVALICYGVLFAATVTQGRAWFALWAPSRYSTCGLLILGGCYLVALDRPPPWARLAFRATATGDRPERRSVSANTVIWVGLAVAICLQVIFGTGHGLASAKSWSQSQKEVADIIVNVDEASNSLVQSELLRGNPLVSRQLVQAMRVHRMSLFATGAVDYYSRIGLLPQLTALQVQVAKPAHGAVLNGTSLLDAIASDPSGTVKVDFRLSGDGVHDALIAAAKPSAYGWIAAFNTMKYPNGSYDLRSVAYGFGGKTSYSPAVRVTLDNPP
jgi:hypothetical protein